ncbi:MAG: hypothetical protein C4K49_12240 [Candidatus Thorarchaeota archaeon]|nr:MAG: hypothetical protein C4K49_12240 [Candidatus Thorarchaeota archaeon]
MSKAAAALDLIGIHLDSSEMKVLRYLFKASRGPQRVTFSAVYDQIKKTKAVPPTKVWVYECLRKLETAGFISVDKLSRPSSYVVSNETIANGLERAWRNRLDSIESEIELLTRATAEDLAAFLYKSATGSPTQQNTNLARGVENVRRLIRSELLDRKQWKAGDELKLIHRLDNLIGAKGTSGPVDKEIVAAAMDGLNVRVVFIASDIPINGLGVVATFMRDEVSQLASLLSSGRLQFRLYPEDIATYRIVALNRSKLVMLLTNAFRPDTAVLLDRTEQPIVVEHAMQRFDTLWDQSIDARALMATLFAKSVDPNPDTTA